MVLARWCTLAVLLETIFHASTETDPMWKASRICGRVYWNRIATYQVRRDVSRHIFYPPAYRTHMLYSSTAQALKHGQGTVILFLEHDDLWHIYPSPVS